VQEVYMWAEPPDGGRKTEFISSAFKRLKSFFFISFTVEVNRLLLLLRSGEQC